MYIYIFLGGSAIIIVSIMTLVITLAEPNPISVQLTLY